MATRAGASAASRSGTAGRLPQDAPVRWPTARDRKAWPGDVPSQPPAARPSSSVGAASVCSSKQAWRTSALVLVPLIFAQLGAVMNPPPPPPPPAASSWWLGPGGGHDLHRTPHQQQHQPFVTLASILERSPLFSPFVSSWWIDLAVLLGLIGVLHYMSTPAAGCVTTSAEQETAGGGTQWKRTAFHTFLFFAAFFNGRQCGALVNTVFMLLSSTAKAKADTIDREAIRLTDGRAYPPCTRVVNTVWWAFIFGATDIAFLLPHLACLLVAYSLFSSGFRFKYSVGVASCFLLFPLLVVVSYMMDTVARTVLHFAFAPRSVVFSRYFSSDVMLLQSASFIYHIILIAKLSSP